MTLRGFPGRSRDTLPFVLKQVLQTWELYGGEGCSEGTLQKLAKHGAEYVLATLKHFGILRHALLAGKDPEAPRHAYTAPLQAKRAFDQHVQKLEGSMAVVGYIEYGVGGGATADATTSNRQKKEKRKREQGAGTATGHSAIKGGWTVTPDHAKQMVLVRQGAEARGTYAFDKLNEHAVAGRRACLRGLVIAGLRAANTISEETAEAIKCTKCSRAAATSSHAWQEGSRLSACKHNAKKGKAPGAEAATIARKQPPAGKTRKQRESESEPDATDAAMTEDDGDEGGDDDAEGDDQAVAESGAETSGSEGSSPDPKRKRAKGGGKPTAGKGKTNKGFHRR